MPCARRRQGGRRPFRQAGCSRRHAQAQTRLRLVWQRAKEDHEPDHRDQAEGGRRENDQVPEASEGASYGVGVSIFSLCFPFLLILSEISFFIFLDLGTRSLLRSRPPPPSLVGEDLHHHRANLPCSRPPGGAGTKRAGGACGAGSHP